jgi:hypothetical protein
MSRLIYGVGINDADYTAVESFTINGKRKQIWCPFYADWADMLKRCYCKKYQAKNPTYKNCKVSPEWLSFMSFRDWASKQDIKNKALDKDILANLHGKLYSQEFCCYVPVWLNSLFNDSKAIRGKCPLGVDKNYKKFRARCRVNNRRIHIGSFDTSQKAHEAYCDFKRNHVRELIKDYPDERIKEAVELILETHYTPKKHSTLGV